MDDRINRAIDYVCKNQSKYRKFGNNFFKNLVVTKIMDDDNWERLDGSDKNYEKEYMNMYDYLYSLLPENCGW